ncbi:MAG: hypothetical protein DHS20C17_05880 [Cyclobacteriaceae bacterium]|nr:MAG: hypothetical protein DHS20C17_05880 [Cyclobacteriaceae bacterium]
MLCYTSLSAQPGIQRNLHYEAQQYLVLDRYGRNRVRIPLGSEVTFKLKGDDRKHSSRLVGLADSVVIMGNNDIYLHLRDFEVFYFHRSHWKALRYGTMIPAAGFLIGAAVYPLVSDPFYDQEDSALIGLGFLALGQSFRLLEWKKFKVNKNARIWVAGY